MILNILLCGVYSFIGFVLAVLGATSIGFAFAALVGLLNLFAYKWAWALVIAYAVAAR